MGNGFAFSNNNTQLLYFDFSYSFYFKMGFMFKVIQTISKFVSYVVREANSLFDGLAKIAHVFGFVTQVLHFPLTEYHNSILHKDVEEALASLRAPVV